MNLPNILTVLRMVMIPIVIAFFAADLPYWALAFFLLAEFTDFLDGHIARRYNLVTKFGKVMDPLADKLMLMTTLFCLYATDRIPLWVPIVICIKECSMIVIGALLYRKDVVLPANFFGKLATVLFTAAVLLSFFSDIVSPWHTYVLSVATAVALLAMAIYGVIIVRTNPQLFHKRRTVK
ncbi:MAG: CDP-diacylglycerol--glycerol-3-phosphate 3-phosphatidyltransferase [Candidatus Spyradocola sp.]|jgi:cardiolipin synthase